MAIAVVIILLVVGTLLFHFLSPWYFTPIASNWTAVDTTVDITFIVCGIVFVLINAFLAYCVIKFRHKEGSFAHYEPENKKLEVGLTIFTSIGVIAMLAPGLFVWANFVEVPDDALEIEVVGQQWHWSYRYPGEDATFGSTDVSHMTADNPFGINPEDPSGQDDVVVYDANLRLLKGRPVKLWLRSKDVLHNFTVAQFRVKMDLVPGMVTYLWLEPTVSGEYDILCEELCGVAHYAMRGRVIVEEEPAYSNWLATQKTFAQTLQENSSDITNGRAMYAVCASCHGQSGEGNETLNAPRLAGMSAWYIEQQINKFKNGQRGAHDDDTYGRQMAPMAATLASVTSTKNVAAYIESLADTSTSNSIAGDVDNGRRLYMTCGSCHGKQGEGIWSTNAPRLAGINDWYLLRQLNNFKNGVRGYHSADATGKQMVLLSGMLKDEQSINDVVAYINTLQP